jgi:hypothetical protein
MPLHAPNGGDPSGPAADFYIDVLKHLVEQNIPFLIGGGYAVEIYTDIRRRTKDIDLFLLPADVAGAIEGLCAAGYQAEVVYDHWLAKVRQDGELIDIIFGSANGGGGVDQAWFQYAVETRILDLPMKLCPPEEMIWQKAFVMARDRFDGADVMHLLRSCGERLDWQRLGDRFGSAWRVLLSHLVLFGYAYPGHRSLIPTWVMDQLLERLQAELGRAPDEEALLCRGTMLCFEDFRVAVERWGYVDARPAPLGSGHSGGD